MISGGAGEILIIRKGESEHHYFETIYVAIVFLLVLVVGLLLIPSLGLFVKIFDLDHEKYLLFRNLSLFFVFNMLPGVFISVLRPMLYAKGLYKFFTYTSISSQLVGIMVILLTVKSSGIYSFAYGTVTSSLLNAFWFVSKANLRLRAIFTYSNWQNEVKDLLAMLRNLFSLSAQTMFNYLGTLWERSLSVKYLSGGYLSALNYSKTLTEIPNTVLFSSVLTTSYIEQVKLFNSDISSFQKYTEKIFRSIIHFGFIMQILMMVLSPLIIIIIFRHGKFDNAAVQSTLVIFSILTISFLPKLIMSYLSRTLYIFGEYRHLLIATIFKFLVQLVIMTAFINNIKQAIPLAILFGHLTIAFLLLYYTKKHISLPGIGYLFQRLLFVSISSYLALGLHYYLLDLYILKSNLQILAIYSPIILLSTILFVYFLRRSGIRIPFIEKLFEKWQKTGN